MKEKVNCDINERFNAPLSGREEIQPILKVDVVPVQRIGE